MDQLEQLQLGGQAPQQVPPGPVQNNHGQGQQVQAQNHQTRNCLPSPESRDAPKFRRDKPENLLRFLSRYEKLLDQVGIRDDYTKKEEIMQYADAQTESEWRALPAYENGSYANFRKELVASYPEAVDIAGGSVTKLDVVCSNYNGIGSKDQTLLLKFKREFMAEAKKLRGIVPVIISNRELVNKFLNCLHASFREAVFTRLGSEYRPPQQANQNERRNDDPYDLDDVIRVALSISGNTSSLTSTEQNYTYSGRATNTSSRDNHIVKQEMEQIRQDIVNIKDMMVAL